MKSESGKIGQQTSKQKGIATGAEVVTDPPRVGTDPNRKSELFAPTPGTYIYLSFPFYFRPSPHQNSLLYLVTEPQTNPHSLSLSQSPFVALAIAEPPLRTTPTPVATRNQTHKPLSLSKTEFGLASLPIYFFLPTFLLLRYVFLTLNLFFSM